MSVNGVTVHSLAKRRLMCHDCFKNAKNDPGPYSLRLTSGPR